MKRYSIIAVLLCLLASVTGTLKAQERDTLATAGGQEPAVVREVVYVHDTVYIQAEAAKKLPEDIIYTKAIGRYDRGIINYRFIPKGKWVGGATFSYADYDSDDSRLLFSLLKDFSCHARTVSIKPYIGYAIRDNIVVGAKLGFNRTLVQLDNLALNIDDLDFSLKDIRYTTDSYSFAAFHRSYVGLDSGRRFGLFNETTLGYYRGSSRFSRGKHDDSLSPEEEEFLSTETTLNELKIGLNPGIAVFIMQNVSAEVSFGVAGFSYCSEKQTNTRGESGRRRSSGANFKINILNINIGITLCM